MFWLYTLCPELYGALRNTVLNKHLLDLEDKGDGSHGVTFPNSTEIYVFTVHDTSVPTDDMKRIAINIKESIEIGGFDELLLDERGGYARVSRKYKRGYPTYGIRSPLFKASSMMRNGKPGFPNGGKLPIPKAKPQVVKKVKRDIMDDEPDRKINDKQNNDKKKSSKDIDTKKQLSHRYSDKESDDSESSSEPERGVRKQDSKSSKEVKNKDDDSSSSGEESQDDSSSRRQSRHDSVRRSRSKDSSSDDESEERKKASSSSSDESRDDYVTIPERTQRHNNNQGNGSGAIIVGAVGFAVVIGVVAYAASRKTSDRTR